MQREEELIGIAARYGAEGRQGDLYGIGDDCAVYPGPGGLSLVTTCDMLCEGTHFLMEYATPRELGRKAAAVNVSDVAAMGGEPRWAFVSVGLPEADAAFLEELYKGMSDCLGPCGAVICGGDTVRSGSIVISITVTGTARRPVFRSGAREGDDILYCGTPGASAAGLGALTRLGRKAALERWPEPVKKHLLPEPVTCSPLIADLAHAMMDASDGISKDLGAICAASGLGARLEEELIPLWEPLLEYCRDTGEDPLRLALAGGEDYGLLVTAAPEDRGRIADVMKEHGVPCHRLGVMTAGPAKAELTGRPGGLPEGWQHFTEESPWK
ncbi:MAG: thiamine-phosphate kinase [Abditibacteriota bacterium]|nr:thiamine-phosphate kinase [Abditibacteriota bacterium]